MEYRNIPDVKLEDRPASELIFRNFSGTPSAYNASGRRSVTLVLEPDLANALAADGWNVKEKETRDGDIRYQLQVFVNFANPRKRPRITMVRSGDVKGIAVDEDNIVELDSAEIEKFDIRITPYPWELPTGAQGIKAFVKSMNVVIEHDDIADKYSGFGRAAEEGEELPFL